MGRNPTGFKTINAKIAGGRNLANQRAFQTILRSKCCDLIVLPMSAAHDFDYPLVDTAEIGKPKINSCFAFRTPFFCE